MKDANGLGTVPGSNRASADRSPDPTSGAFFAVPSPTSLGRASGPQRRAAWIAALVLGASSIATVAAAQVTTLPVNKCLAGKLQAAGKSAAARTSCYQKEARSGMADPDCLLAASDKFSGGVDPAKGAFGKLEAKYSVLSDVPCLTFTDQSGFDSDLSAFAATVPAATGSAPGKCDAAKIKCVGKYVASALKCSAKAATKTGTVDPECTQKAVAKLADGTKGCLYKAAANDDCTNAGSQSSALLDLADAFVEDATCSLSPGNDDCDLFEFSSFTFLPLVAAGSPTGPSLSTMQVGYAGEPWNPDYLGQGAFQGYQRWTVPKTGDYTIIAGGAAGGDGNEYGTSLGTRAYGAVVLGTFGLTKGDVLEIVVGVNGGRSGGPHGSENGGGGGTFVKNVTTGTLLLVAGGGGGAPASAYGTTCIRNISVGVGQSGTASGSTAGCVAVATPTQGNGGTTAGSFQGGGGGGYLGAGADGGTHCATARGGSGYASGLVGGSGNNCYSIQTAGGFGGGGGGQISGPGAGGGYTGGTASGHWTDYSTYGGGGGSWNAGTNPSSFAGANTETLGGSIGMGFCIITAL